MQALLLLDCICLVSRLVVQEEPPQDLITFDRNHKKLQPLSEHAKLSRSIELFIFVLLQEEISLSQHSVIVMAKVLGFFALRLCKLHLALLNRLSWCLALLPE